MQRRLIVTSLAAAVGLGAVAWATRDRWSTATGPSTSGAAPDAAPKYDTLPVPVPRLLADESGREVLEFFWYGCPHCFHFDPTLSAWAKRQAADVHLHRVPVGGTAAHALHQQLFYTLEALGALPALHARVFEAIHVDKLRLVELDEIAGWAAAHGIAEARFRTAWADPAHVQRLQQADGMATAWGIDSVPTLGLLGRFRTSPGLAGGETECLAVADALLAPAPSALSSGEAASVAGARRGT